jgi:hypothetical protein
VIIVFLRLKSFRFGFIRLDYLKSVITKAFLLKQKTLTYKVKPKVESESEWFRFGAFVSTP